MPLNINLDINPYFDDYNANNQYYRILFKPAIAVQARELSQLQSILQNQVEQFGNWAFQNGDIVSGCGISDLPSLPYIRLADFTTNSSSYDVTQLVNTQIVSLSSNLTARVVYANRGLASNYPNTNIAYVIYTNTGTGGQQAFSNTEQLSFYNIGNNTPILSVNSYIANSVANTYTTGNAHAISVDKGVAYLNGIFVNVLEPTIGIVNAYGVDAGNSVVGFVLQETIVTADQDASLYDNALGYSNENAPGADRLKLAAGLLAISSSNTIANTAGFNPIATYNYNSLIATANAASSLYSVVNDAISKRVYDESGNFVVNPFAISTLTSANSIISNLSPNNALAVISPGSGYAQGDLVTIQKTAYINIRRGVDTAVKKQQLLSFNYGGYFILDEVSGTFDFPHANTVTLYNQPQLSVTDRVYSTLTPTGTAIGTAAIRCFTYAGGAIGSNTAQYYLHVYNIKMNAGYNINQIQSVYSSTGVGDLAVSGIVGANYDDQLYSFHVSGLKALRDASNNINTEYVYRSQANTTLTSGVATYTISSSASGGVDQLPYGTGILSDALAQSFIVINTANVQSAALSGTVNVYSTNTYVNGTGTNFLSNFVVGSQIVVGSTIRTISAVTNSTAMYVDAAFAANASSSAYYRYYAAGKILPISLTALDTPSYINVTNSTSFTLNMTFNSGSSPVSALPLTIVYNTLRTTVSPAQKVINKNRYVLIDTTKNPNGPWCLGYPDVHQITAIYGAVSNTYTTAGSLITSSFVFDSGATDASYGLGYIYPTSTGVTSVTPYLLVQLDYFSTNNSPGVGFFTIESYPIDDANTANTNAIQTQNIPLYVDGAGNQIWLRDYIDFRTPAIPTANDTGICNTANVSQVTTAISYATYNPSNTVSYLIPTSGLNNPAWSQNFQADYTIYLPRQDLIYITPDNVLKAKEGVSSSSPQAPLFPDNAMALSVLNIPPYPSMTADQLNTVSAENKLSKNLSRYTAGYITTSLVTNRRYTMQDIGKLDNRITNLEYYVSLNLLQQTTQNLTVTNANGLNRFKNGIFADPFNDFTYSAVSDPEYSISIDSSKSEARPKIIREVVNIKFNSGISTNVQQTGRAITLPYTEARFITQPYATEYRSAALVAFSWNGVLNLIPSYDNQIDTTTTAAASITINNATSWQQFANSPFSSIWGDWRTTTNTVSQTVSSGTPSYITENVVGYSSSDNASAINYYAPAPAPSGFGAY